MLFKVESFSDSYVCCIMQSEGIIKAYFYIPDTSLEFKKKCWESFEGLFFSRTNSDKTIIFYDPSMVCLV